jgi:hypothetical protein
MSTATLTEARARLEEAKAHVAQIEAEIAAEERVAAIAQLENVRTELHQKTALYEQTKRDVIAQREDRANALTHLRNAQEAVNESNRLRPPVALYLPSDPDVTRWQKQHIALELKRNQRKAEHDALPDPDVTVEPVAGFEGPAGVLAQLHYAEQNLLRRLEGRSGKAFLDAVGVSAVS